MKLNIQKFQGGGTGLGSLFSSVQVAAPSAAPTANTDDSDKASDAILSESTLNKLRSLEYGLPNELDRFEMELAALEQKLNSGRRVSPREIADIRAKAGRLIAQAGHLKNAEQNAEKNGFLDDVAIDYRGVGYIYAITEKGLDKVSFQQYNPQKHRALTYSELIEYRRQSPQLINDAEVIASINKGVGLEKVNSFITDILKIINESGSKQEAYTSLKAVYDRADAKQLSQQEYLALKDIAAMVENVGLDTIFKTTNISNNANLQHAFKYIASILPKNMQAQLEASYIVNGGSYKDAKTYVGSVIEFATLAKEKNDFEVEYPKEFNTVMGTKAGAKSDPKEYTESPLEVFFNGNLNQKEISISDPTHKNQYKLVVKGNEANRLMDVWGNPVEILPMSVALDKTLGQFLDYSKVYMGDGKISESELDNIVYGRDKIQQVFMPVTMNGDIDWKGMKGYSKAEEEIKNRNITDIKTKRQIHAKHGSYMTYDSDGTLKPVQKTAAFFRTWGYSIDDRVDKVPGITMYEELTGEEEDQVDNWIVGAYNKSTQASHGLKQMAQRQYRDDIMRVPVFIKISPNASSDVKIVAKHGPRQEYHSESDFMVQQQINNEGAEIETSTTVLK